MINIITEECVINSPTHPFFPHSDTALALCDWTNLQQKRRNLARKHCSPRDTSAYYAKMSEVGCQEMDEFMVRMRRDVPDGQDYHIKPLVQRTCANMFSQYMCSTRFDYDDEQFQEITKCFDDIFWEINQGYALDFLPCLAPFYSSHLSQIVKWSTKIRTFILDRIVGDRETYVDLEEPEKDFTDALLRSLLEDPDVQRDTIIYMLEDFLGGHSAIGNLVMLCLAYVVRYPEVGVRIQQEVDAVTRDNESDSKASPRKVTLFDTDAMPYTVATIFEVLRFSSSPIVPHVATEDAIIAGYGITKGTMVFINNYDLNTSAEYWNEPATFRPERFLEWVPACTVNHSSTAATTTLPMSAKNMSTTTATAGVAATAKTMMETSSDSGVESDDVHSDGGTADEGAKFNGISDDTTVVENDEEVVFLEREINGKRVLRVKRNIPHFLPFSIGKRTCIGQNLVKGFTFIMLANIMQTYNVSISDPSLIKLYPACVAVPADTFPLALSLRE